MPTIEGWRTLDWLPDSDGTIRNYRAADSQTLSAGDIVYLDNSGLVTKAGHDARLVFGMVMNAYRIALDANKTRTEMLGVTTGTGATVGYTTVNVLVFCPETTFVGSYMDASGMASASPTFIGLATAINLINTRMSICLSSASAPTGDLDQFFVGDGVTNNVLVCIALDPRDAVGTIGGRVICKLIPGTVT